MSYKSEINMPKDQNRANLLENCDLQVAARVKMLFEAGNLTQEELAKELSISQPHISRLLLGKTAWRTKYLQRISELYGTSLYSLLFEPQEVPIVSQLNDDNGFEYATIENQTLWLGKATMPPSEHYLKGLYCVQINSDYFQPVISRGTLLYVRRDSNEIHEDMLVIYMDENGKGLLRQVKYSDDSILLKSLSPSGRYIIRPQAYLRLVDKVEWIKI
jgi:transcriptional regulator with XRE-family HTH domain